MNLVIDCWDTPDPARAECERDARAEWAALPTSCARCGVEFVTYEEADAAIDGHCEDCAQLLAEREALAQHMHSARLTLAGIKAYCWDRIDGESNARLSEVIARLHLLEVGLRTTGVVA